MQLHVPEMRIGEPITHEGVTVRPIFIDEIGDIDYVLGSDAIARKTVSVTEVDQSGRVGTLRVTNDGDVRVLFLEGMVLAGAKQNRVLNTSLLVPARASIEVPVSCVERGRWSHSRPDFTVEPFFASPKVREAVKRTVSQNLASGRGYGADQGEIWKCVESEQAELHVSSPTHSVSDSFRGYEGDVDRVVTRLDYVEGACGLLVQVRGGPAAMELYDRPETCRSVWRQVLAGLFAGSPEALGEGGDGDHRHR